MSASIIASPKTGFVQSRNPHRTNVGVVDSVDDATETSMSLSLGSALLPAHAQSVYIHIHPHVKQGTLEARLEMAAWRGRDLE